MSALLEPGIVLRQRYKIVACVGQGGMGAVYRAEDLRLSGRFCALKEIRSDSDADPALLSQVQEQFHREASTLARLDHPNLPKVSDYFTGRGREYLVMDFVPGRDLKQIMDQERQDGRFLDERQVMDWADQLFDALEYLHGQDPPILHRDIKPANIKVTPEGLVKLVDFGLVKILAPDDARTITVLQGRGTAAYTPLEQYGGDSEHTDVRSDIYSLGATLYHLLTHRHPPDAKQRFLRPDRLIPPRELNSRISPGVERAVLMAMAMHPNDRPASIAVLREVAHDVLLSDTLATLMVPRGELLAALQQNRWMFVLAGTTLLLAVLLTLL